MSHFTDVKMFTPVMKALCAILAMVILPVAKATAQSRTPTDGYTPTGMATGAPAGSYPLSGFDNINLFNGHLSIDLPLLQIGGRGGAGFQLRRPVDRGWQIESRIVNITGSDYEVKDANVRTSYGRAYRPISLIGIRTADRQETSIDCGVIQPVQTLTRLKAVTDDGTEQFLIDETYQGAAQWEDLCNSGNPTGANRGKVFRSRDGGSMTFISDTDIFDDRHSGFNWVFDVSGVLLMNDGTRYRIDGGEVSWIRDRNGNKVTFSGNTITDSLGRQVTINVATPRVPAT